MSETTLTFAAGETSKTARVSVTGDALDEADETVRLTLSGPVNAVLSSSAATGEGTITDDDDPPTVSIGNASVSEGDSGTTNLDFTVSLSAASGRQVTVKYAVDGTDGGTATAGTDYEAVSETTLTFAAGETSKTARVSVTGDTLDEADETVRLTLSGPVNAALSSTAATGEGTITDDEAAPTVTLSLSLSAIDESDQDAGSADSSVSTVTASLSHASAAQITVTVAATAVSPAMSSDFNLSASPTLTFAAGSTSSTGTVTVSAVDNSADEADKQVTVSGTTAGGVSGSASSDPSSVTLTIRDDDGSPSLSIDDASVTEGNSGTANLQFTVTLSPASGQQVTVGYAVDATDRGTATSGADYTAVSAGTLTFAAGDTSKTITVSVIGDVQDEPDETVKLTLSGAVNAALGTATGTGTITDDDDAPTVSLSLSPATIDESDQDAGSADSSVSTVTASLSHASAAQITVAVAAAAGSGATSSDFSLSASPTLAIAAGSTSSTGTVTVSAVDNSADEADKQVTVSGTTAGGVSGSASADPASVTLTITDDDPAPTVSISDASVSEGRQRHGEPGLHGVAVGGQRAAGDGEVRAGRHGRRHGGRGRGLRGGERDDADFRGRGDQPDGAGVGDRGRAGRGGRDGAADAERPGQRGPVVDGGHRRGDDHGRRRSADGVDRQCERAGGRQRHGEPGLHGVAVGGQRAAG